MSTSKINKNAWIPILLAIIPWCCGAQQIVDNICMQVIGTMGISSEKLGKKYDATMGEPMISTLTTMDGSTTITQGFHQPECALAPSSTYDPQFAEAWQVVLMPNPVADYLSINYQHPAGLVLSARIWSITGVLMQDRQPLAPAELLDCTAFPAGIYLLELTDPNNGFSTTQRFVKTTK